jgi:hypothetical protein
MERIPLETAHFEIDGGYLPGSDDPDEPAAFMVTQAAVVDIEQDPERAEELIDASIFTAMLHP